MLDNKIFEYLSTLEEWKELGESFKEILSEMPVEEYENLTQEDIDKVVCEELWNQAIALTARLAYEKIQRDLSLEDDALTAIKKSIVKVTKH